MFVCSKTGHIGHHCPDVQCYNYDGFGTVTQDCSEKISPSGTPHHHDRLCSCSHYNHNCRDISQSFHHITAREKALTGQSHTTDLNVVEAPSTMGGTHPAPYPATAAAQDNHPPTDALGNILAVAPHTSAAATHP